MPHSFLQGARYNIPISVYLWDTHPYYAPICYVCPTPTMVIRESEHVTKQGRVFLPYLNEWRFPGYDLNGLLQVMAMVFQEKCPVFAKSSTASANSTPTPTSATSQPTPSYPTPYPTATPSLPTPYPAMPPYSGQTPYPTTGNQFGRYSLSMLHNCLDFLCYMYHLAVVCCPRYGVWFCCCSRDRMGSQILFMNFAS
ncbi:tumor susceptibility 101 protein [Cooperia oncophora]